MLENKDLILRVYAMNCLSKMMSFGKRIAKKIMKEQPSCLRIIRESERNHLDELP